MPDAPRAPVAPGAQGAQALQARLVRQMRRGLHMRQVRHVLHLHHVPKGIDSLPLELGGWHLSALRLLGRLRIRRLPLTNHQPSLERGDALEQMSRVPLVRQLALLRLGLHGARQIEYLPYRCLQCEYVLVRVLVQLGQPCLKRRHLCLQLDHLVARSADADAAATTIARSYKHLADRVFEQ